MVIFVIVGLDGCKNADRASHSTIELVTQLPMAYIPSFWMHYLNQILYIVLNCLIWFKAIMRILHDVVLQIITNRFNYSKCL